MSIVSETSADAVQRGALSDLIAPVRGKLVFGAVLAGLGAICAMVPFIAVAEIGRTLLDHGLDRPGTVWFWAATAVIGVVAHTLLYAGSLGVCHYADADFRFITRRRLARHLSLLPLGWFSRRGSAAVKKAVTDDVAKVHTLVAHAVADVVSAILSPVVGIVYLLVVDWRLALAVFGYMVLLLAISAPFMQRGYVNNADDYDRALADATRATVELSEGMEVAKAYGTRTGGLSRFESAVDSLVRACIRWTSAMGRPVTIVSALFFPSTLLVLILALGLWFADAGWLAAPDVLPFVVVGLGLPAAFMQIGQLASPIRDAQLGAAELSRLLSAEPLPEPAEPSRPVDSQVVFDRVSFGYDDHEVLTEISAVLAPGTVTALVGPSGSGKSTLARLVPRFYDVDAGSVSIGGVDVREMTTADVLSQVAIVFQETVVLRDTVRENIRLGRPDATDEQVVAAARAAQIHSVIEALPHGYDTVLGGDDGQLSGGERQRITIARAIVQDAPIVILDEATAHADPHSEAAIQVALSKVSQGRTVLVIAHRLHTITGADQILVIDGGRLTEAGTHDELLAREGRYAALWRSQEETTRSAS